MFLIHCVLESPFALNMSLGYCCSFVTQRHFVKHITFNKNKNYVNLLFNSFTKSNNSKAFNEKETYICSKQLLSFLFWWMICIFKWLAFFWCAGSSDSPGTWAGRGSSTPGRTRGSIGKYYQPIPVCTRTNKFNFNKNALY